MRSIVYVLLFVACWYAAIDAFLIFIIILNRLLCYLIVGIEALGMLIPLSLLMLLGRGLKWIVSLTLHVYRWGSQSINLTLLQIGICPLC